MTRSGEGDGAQGRPQAAATPSRPSRRASDPSYAAGTLAGVAGLACFSTGVGIVATVATAGSETITGLTMAAVAVVALVVFGPNSVAAIAAGRGLTQGRVWARMLLLVFGTLVAVVGLVLGFFCVSVIVGGGSTPAPLAGPLEDLSTQALWGLAALAFMHAIAGVLEAGAAVMGKEEAEDGEPASAGSST
jgi:hypothetical protein